MCFFFNGDRFSPLPCAYFSPLVVLAVLKGDIVSFSVKVQLSHSS